MQMGLMLALFMSPPPPYPQLFGYIPVAKRPLQLQPNFFMRPARIKHFIPALQAIPFQNSPMRTSHTLALSNLQDKGSG